MWCFPSQKNITGIAIFPCGPPVVLPRWSAICFVTIFTLTLGDFLAQWHSYTYHLSILLFIPSRVDRYTSPCACAIYRAAAQCMFLTSWIGIHCAHANYWRMLSGRSETPEGLFPRSIMIHTWRHHGIAPRWQQLYSDSIPALPLDAVYLYTGHMEEDRHPWGSVRAVRPASNHSSYFPLDLYITRSCILIFMITTWPVLGATILAHCIISPYWCMCIRFLCFHRSIYI